MTNEARDEIYLPDLGTHIALNLMNWVHFSLGWGVIPTNTVTLFLAVAKVGGSSKGWPACM